MSHLDMAILNILDSIAEEEHSLAKLVAAESHKIKALLDGHPTNHEIIELNQTVTRLMNTILMKEIVLLQKLTATVPFIEEIEEESSSHESTSESTSSHEKRRPSHLKRPHHKPPHHKPHHRDRDESSDRK